MAKYVVSLRDGAGALLFPRTILEQVYSKDGTNRLDNILRLLRENIESDIADTNLAVAQLREELDAFLSDATVSGEVRDAILEIKALLDSNSSDVVGELVATMSALRDEAVRNVAQTMTETQKSTARTNIGAVGVSATYGDGLATISYNGNAIFPETKGTQVKLSIGYNAEDAIKANGENIEKERVRAIAREDEIAETLAETKEKVDVFLADADTSEQAIDKLKELQEYIKNDETAGAQMLGDIAQNKQDIADNATNIDKEATRAKQTEMYLESQKADKSGYYENLSVGIADNLSGRGEATESEFSFRPSGGENKSIPEDGTARINSIKGNSVVWNQQLKSLFSPNLTANSVTSNGITFTKMENGWCNISGSNNTSSNSLSNNSLKNASVIAGHKYIILVRGCKKSTVQYYSLNNTNVTFDSNISGVITPTADSDILLRAKVSGGVTDVNENIFCGLVDLTKMLDKGNEPATVEEFEALYGNMPNEHNEGTIIDNHTTAIKSVGINAWDEEWEYGAYSTYANNLSGGKVKSTEHIRCKNLVRVIPNAMYGFSFNLINSDNHIGFYDKNGSYLNEKFNINSSRFVFTVPTNACYISFYVKNTTYNHDICIHLIHTGYLNGKYFPYESQTRQLPTVEGGLKSAGTAYDEIRYNKGKDKWEYVKRIGSVDLGTLSWQFLAGSEKINDRFASLLQLDNAKKTTFSSRPNTLCAKYKTISGATFLENLSADLGVGIDYTTARVILLDKQYNNDVVALKTSLKDVILYYELAEPVVTELDVDISPDYKVWDYGTEEAISEVLSTPVRINANYGFNAVGQITDNTILIQELLARVAVLEAQIAQANSVSVEPIEPIVE